MHRWHLLLPVILVLIISAVTRNVWPQATTERFVPHVFFHADDGIHGFELWKSNGQPQGTSLVKDIRPGPETSLTELYYVYEPGIDLNGTVLFVADDGKNGLELWKSDGTDAGTLLLKDIYAGPGSSKPAPLVSVGRIVFFPAKDREHGTELWQTDGTVEGTRLVKDIRPGIESSSPLFLEPFGTKLLFVTDDGQHGLEFWTSDGTEDGTVLLKDIYPGPNPVAPVPGPVARVGDIFLLSAKDGVHGAELWKTDGTQAGTVLVKDIQPGMVGSVAVRGARTVGGFAYFEANDGVHGGELWRSDGTESGTTMVKDVRPGPMSSSSYPLATLPGRLLFMADDGTHGMELWRSDGTEAGTQLVKDIDPGSAYGLLPGCFSGFVTIGGRAFFCRTNGAQGPELWRTDGTEAGTTLVKAISVAPAGGAVPRLINVYRKLYFTAVDMHGLELWKSDGTEAGTVLVRDIRLGVESSIPEGLTRVNLRVAE